MICKQFGRHGRLDCVPNPDLKPNPSPTPTGPTTEQVCNRDPFSDSCEKALRAEWNAAFKRASFREQYCRNCKCLLTNKNCRDWCTENIDACRSILREFCPGILYDELCACFQSNSYYQDRANELADAMGKPRGSVASSPHCVFPPCALSSVKPSQLAPCQDLIQQTCIQDLSLSNRGQLYALGGVNQIAQCIFKRRDEQRDSDELHTIDQRQTLETVTRDGATTGTGSDTLQARIRSWFGRFGPDFMLPAAAIALVVVLLLLWEDKDEVKP